MKFVADRTLGKLARKLRILGFDVLDRRGGNPNEPIEASPAEGRILLTRSRKTGDKAREAETMVIAAEDPEEQLREVMARFPSAAAPEKVFSRCPVCNEKLQPLPREEAEGRVPEFIGKTHRAFRDCPRCRRVYWPGTHYENLKRKMSGFFPKGK